jgi:hypothetical protein
MGKWRFEGEVRRMKLSLPREPAAITFGLFPFADLPFLL